MKTLWIHLIQLSKIEKKKLTQEDKADIAVVMVMHIYCEMFLRNFSNREYYTCKGHYNPTEVLDKLITDFAMKRKEL